MNGYSDVRQSQMDPVRRKKFILVAKSAKLAPFFSRGGARFSVHELLHISSRAGIVLVVVRERRRPRSSAKNVSNAS